MQRGLTYPPESRSPENAAVVDAATAGLKFASFPEPWLPIETVSR
jgi:hypothetical protein